MFTQKEKELLAAYNAVPLGKDEKEWKAFRAAARKNEKQRALRATPEGRAKEAQASRRSYWKKTQGYGRHGEWCSVCARMKEKYDL